MKVQAIALNTFREAVRNKIVYSVLLFAAVIVGISAVFGAVTLGSQIRVIKDFGLFALSFFGAVITIICGVSLLNKELKQKTVYNILSKPVARWQLILGKHLGLTFTVTVLVSLMGAALIGFVALFEGQPDWLLAQGVALTILEVTVVSSITLFFSSLVVTTTLTGIFTMGVYLAGRSISYLQFFLKEDSEGFNPALAGIINCANWVLPDLSLFNLGDQLVYGHGVSWNYFATAIVYCAAYSTVMLGLATVIFERRELN